MWVTMSHSEYSLQICTEAQMSRMCRLHLYLRVAATQALRGDNFQLLLSGCHYLKSKKPSIFLEFQSYLLCMGCSAYLRLLQQESSSDALSAGYRDQDSQDTAIYSIVIGKMMTTIDLELLGENVFGKKQMLQMSTYYYAMLGV